MIDYMYSRQILIALGKRMNAHALSDVPFGQKMWVRRMFTNLVFMAIDDGAGTLEEMVHVGPAIDKCQICGRVCQQQPSHDKLCDGCWECVSRLPDVLKYSRGVEMVAAELNRALLLKAAQ
jgi:hypothetical protein